MLCLLAAARRGPESRSGTTRNRIHKTGVIKKRSIECFFCKCILCSILVAIQLEYPFFTY